MSFLWCILIDLVVVWFFFGNWIAERLLPRKTLLRRQLKAAARRIRGIMRRDGDMLSSAQRESLAAARNDVLSALEMKNADEMERALRSHGSSWAPPSFRHHGAIAVNLEAIIVSVAVAFAIRSLLLQPFKIPTGSMQPTLYGIHHVPLETEEIPSSRLVRIFDYLNYSRRYFNVVAPADGQVEFDAIRPMPSKPLFPKTALPFLTADGEVIYKTVPASPTDTRKMLYDLYARQPADTPHSQLVFKEGEIIAQGAMESGDHLFANRLSLCFNNPERGDILVFSTEGLAYNGKTLGGAFYVKRLVGMPGDTLKILNRTIHVKPDGERDFFPLDKSYSDVFGKINSMKDGYTGHSTQPTGQFLKSEGEEFTVPEGHYFLMGDNTDNSLDCRFFGPVPRKNLVGSPCLVWWPFSRRFGFGFK